VVWLTIGAPVYDDAFIDLRRAAAQAAWLVFIWQSVGLA
jgi:uncharacterized protein (DUF1810 family)